MASSPTRRHVGRPRDPELDRAILSATLEELGEHGYRAFTLEAVATRADTTKPTIARRWPRRQELIVAALASVVVRPPMPDTGCPRCDLSEGLRLLADGLLRRIPPGVLAPLIADCAPDPSLLARLNEELLRPSRDMLVGTVRRAVDRGELRVDTDPDLVVELLASVVFQSGFLLDTPFDLHRADQAVDLVLRGAAVDFDALVEAGEMLAVHPHPHGP